MATTTHRPTPPTAGRRSAAARGRAAHPAVERADRWAGRFLLAAGIAVACLWAVSLPGAFHDGLFRYAGTDEAGNIPLFHLVAEGVMAAVAIVAGLATIRGDHRGRLGALLAAGMLIYSAINSSGWLIENQPPVTLLTAATLVGSVLVAWVVLVESARRGAEGAGGSGGRSGR